MSTLNQGTNMTKNITIYTTNNCAYCVMVKKYLGMKGMNYEEVNVEEHPDRRAEAIELSGAMTVPVTVVTKTDDSRHVTVGYNPSSLASALA
jgi:glutaredoxin